MERYLHYVCMNSEQPDTNSDEKIEIESPLYEDLVLNNSISEISSIEDLMSSFSFAGERAYLSIESNSIIGHLVPVVKVNASIEEGVAFIEYIFADGRKYIPERDYIADDYFSMAEIKSIVEMAKEAASHLYYLDTSVCSSLFEFDKELWG